MVSHPVRDQIIDVSNSLLVDENIGAVLVSYIISLIINGMRKRPIYLSLSPKGHGWMVGSEVITDLHQAGDLQAICRDQIG